MSPIATINKAAALECCGELSPPTLPQRPAPLRSPAGRGSPTPS